MNQPNFVQPTGAPLSLPVHLSRMELDRLTRYNTFWRYYLSQHWLSKPDEGEQQFTLNYCQAIVDAGYYYLLAKPPKFARETEEGETEEQSKQVMDFLKKVWKYHSPLDLFLLELAITGGVTGDAFVVVTNYERDLAGRQLPEDEFRVGLSIHDSSLVFPEFSFFPFGALVKVELWHPWTVPDPLNKDDPTAASAHIFREVITADQIREYVDGEELTKASERYGVSFLGSRPNPLKRINVIHVRNIQIPREFYGMSDLQGVVNLNHGLNQQMTEVADILAYFASPVTVIKGAKAADLSRGANKVWSGLPPDGDVSNLEMKGDLAGSNLFFEGTRSALLEVARMPEIAMGRKPPTGVLTGPSLTAQYGPILERGARKSPSYRDGLRKICEMVLRIGELRYGLKVARKGLGKYHVDVTLNLNVPHSEKEKLDAIEQRLGLKLTSRAQVWREEGVENVEQLEREIDEELEKGILPQPTTPGATKPNFRGGAQPPRSSNPTQPPKNPSPGTGRPPGGET